MGISAMEDMTPAMAGKASAVANETSAIADRAYAMEDRTSAIANGAYAIADKIHAMENRASAIADKSYSIEDRATSMEGKASAMATGPSLAPKEKTTHEQGLVSVLRQLHDELDRIVFEAYGWRDLAEKLVGKPGATTPWPEKPDEQTQAEEQLLQRLVALKNCNVFPSQLLFSSSYPWLN